MYVENVSTNMNQGRAHGSLSVSVLPGVTHYVPNFFCHTHR